VKESVYQAHVIRMLRTLFPGCFIVKNDSNYLQGIPDLTIFYGERWAMLEVKPTRGSRVQPNQEHYVELLNEMSFAAFIYPENEEEVLDALQQSFGTRRSARVSKRK
jgi:hypothetical protein